MALGGYWVATVAKLPTNTTQQNKDSRITFLCQLFLPPTSWGGQTMWLPKECCAEGPMGNGGQFNCGGLE